MDATMTLEQQFEEAFDNDDLYDQYAEYIMENCHGERVIGNGDMLIEAMEGLYLYESFKEQWIDQQL